MPSLRRVPPIVSIVGMLILALAPARAHAEETGAQPLSAPPLSAQAQPRGVAADVERMPQLENDGVHVFGKANRLWLALQPKALEEQKAVIPRLCAPIRSIGWSGDASDEIKFVPEPDHWVFSWKQPGTREAQEKQAMIEVVFDRPPVLLENSPPASADGDGSVLLHAYQAKTFGEKLRFEPQWYKNTVGYWTVPSDYATWELTIDQPGEFSVALLQGCGQGQGGSQAVVSLRQQDEIIAELEFTTIDTGHFQNFRWNHLGKLKVAEAGSYQLRIEPKRIAKAALFDVRMIHLVKQAKADD